VAKLIVFREEQSAFELSALEEILQTWPGIRRLEPTSRDREILIYEYTSESRHAADISLHHSRNALSISGEYFSILEICLWLQRQYPTTLCVIDESYSFHLRLADFATVEQLDREICKH
jgi:hypothetical protein